MAEAFAKFRIGTPGAGTSHASYITRLSALEPDKRQNRGTKTEANRAENTVATTLDDNLNDRALARQSDQDVDPVWTWNAPMFLTGDDCGSGASRSSRGPRAVTERDHLLTEKMMARVTSSNHRSRLKEKVANVRAYFGSKEQFEKAKGGRTHYRLILSFDVAATNSQIRDLTNRFLKEAFPKANGSRAARKGGPPRRRPLAGGPSIAPSYTTPPREPGALARTKGASPLVAM